MKKSLLGASLMTVTLLYGVLTAVLILISMLLGIEIIYSLIIGIIVVLLLQFFISPWLTDLSMKYLYRADFNRKMPEYMENFIAATCKKYNMKYPKIGYIDDGAPNAFTYGRGKNSTRIVVTRGIFELLTPEEAMTVVAHELGHATHYDMAIMTFAQLVPMVLYAIYEMTTKNVSDDDDSKAAILGYVAYVLYIIAQYVILWLSRSREYYADSFAVEETKNPNGLASALVKIGYGLSTTPSTQKSKSNALGIFDTKASKSLAVTSYKNGAISTNSIKEAMKWEQWNVWAKFYELQSTHPLISKRLLKISERSNEFNQEKFITFDLQKPESFVDDFIKEFIIWLLPNISLIFTVIVLCIFAFNNSNGLGAIVDNAGILILMGVGVLVWGITSLIKLAHAYKNKNYQSRTVESLLGEVKVSHVTSVPCVLNGTIIGRGDPGYVLNEDFVLQDQTGIIFLDYNQVLGVINAINALFKSKQYLNKNVTVKGWYRRAPVPYVEIYEMIIDGKTKKCYTYLVKKIFTWLLIILAIVLFVVALV